MLMLLLLYMLTLSYNIDYVITDAPMFMGFTIIFRLLLTYIQSYAA